MRHRPRRDRARGVVMRDERVGLPAIAVQRSAGGGMFERAADDSALGRAETGGADQAEQKLVPLADEEVAVGGVEEHLHVARRRRCLLQRDAVVAVSGMAGRGFDHAVEVSAPPAFENPLASNGQVSTWAAGADLGQLGVRSGMVSGPSGYGHRAALSLRYRAARRASRRWSRPTGSGP